jgi:hypothetical protein
MDQLYPDWHLQNTAVMGILGLVREDNAALSSAQPCCLIKQGAKPVNI